MYGLFFMTKAERVDSTDPASALNKLRNQLFALLQSALLDSLPAGIREEDALAYARIYFYALHGIVATYSQSEEPLQSLLQRLSPTFELTVDVLIAGCSKMKIEGLSRNESGANF
jgi:hypothetical protein